MGKFLTLTVVANMTANYRENVNGVESIQRIYKGGKPYAIRTRESLKSNIMSQSGLNDDVVVTGDTVATKSVNAERNVSNCRALEGGYMDTSKSITYSRRSSFFLTDAIAVDRLVDIDSHVHKNSYLSNRHRSANNIDMANIKNSGLTTYQYEFDKSLKVYSITIDLDMIGKETNFGRPEANNIEKSYRVKALLRAVKELSFTVKGSLDNTEPIFAVGGISDRRTHVFENAVKIQNGSLNINDDLKEKLDLGFSCGLRKADILRNEKDIAKELSPKSIDNFFDDLMIDVDKYYKI